MWNENRDNDINGEQGLNNTGQQLQVSRMYGLLHLMRISNEFVIMRDSMEMFPLPGNEVEPEVFPSRINAEFNAAHGVSQGRATDLMLSLSMKAELNRAKIRDLAVNAMDELTKLSMEKEPLWQYDPNKDAEVLNYTEYNRIRFTILDETLDEVIKLIAADAPLNMDNLNRANNIGLSAEEHIQQARSNSQVEAASRATANYIQMPPLSVVYIFMDVKLWSFFFSDILARAMVLGILSPGPPTLDGALQVMSAEYHAPSPLVPTRESYFARYCKMLAYNVWMVVDVSLEDLLSNNPLMSCKRRPSGCLIEGLPGGTTKVTWIEHVQAENAIVPTLFKPLVESGFIYGANRWIDVLVRQSERLQLIVQHSISNLLPGNAESVGMDGLLRLTERMKRSFCSALSATKAYSWKPIPFNGREDILVKTHEVEGDHDHAAFLTVTTSFWLPTKPKIVLQYLRNEKNQVKWDLLGYGYRAEEALHLHGGVTTDNVISVIKMVEEEEEENTTSIMLQESHESATGSYVVFAPLDLPAMACLLDGHDMNGISILPSGFIVLPDQPGRHGEGSTGSVVTVAVQLFDKSARLNFIPADSVDTLLTLIVDCESRIRNALVQAPQN
ncbi:hypothetical protein Dimus_019112 [Dionaea muscipula]